MQELREELKKRVVEKLAPYLLKFGFQLHLSINEFNDTHDLFRFEKKDHSYIHLDHPGFHFHDYPWNIVPMLGQTGFKKTTNQFDAVPMWYWKQKLAPSETWQREALKLILDDYAVNSIEQINNAIEQIIDDLDNFCKDFLTGNYVSLNRMREIRYLEYLVQIQVFGEYSRTGEKKFTFYNNKEVK